MKKRILSLVLAVGALCTMSARAQLVVPTGTVELNFTLGQLSTLSGTPVADGSLIQFLAAGSSSFFGPPVTTDFLGQTPGPFILWQGSFDSTTTGIPGAMVLSLTENLYAAGTMGSYLKAGDALMVRWYPQLSGSSIPSAPGLISYGQYTAFDWIVPPAGAVGDYSLITVGLGGDVSDASGLASLVVGTPVPEASTFAYVLGGGILVLGLALQRLHARKFAA
jgi:hypothetical protein